MRAKRQRLAERPEIILEAADAVLRAGGARALTIDAVAAAAGLSKGGVLHHYVSKDALILALVERKMADLREGIAAHEAERPEEPARLPLAMLAHARETYAQDEECSRALLLASIEKPEALNDYRAFVAEQLTRLGAGSGTGDGQGGVLFFAILGIVMGRTLGFHQLSADDLAPIFATLERAARDREPGSLRAAARAAPDGGAG